jgi:hypothetical protein
LQSPAEYVLDSRHSGTQPWERSLIEIMPAHVEVLSIKTSEWSDAVIVRVQERAGLPTVAHLRSQVLRVDSDVELSPWQILTLAISSSGTLRPISILER